jgi:hypothetical protein
MRVAESGYPTLQPGAKHKSEMPMTINPDR